MITEYLARAIAKKHAGGGSGGAGVVNIIEAANPTKADLGNFKKLGPVSFPKAESIGLEAFRECTSLTSINLPIATSIWTEAFSRCTSMTSVDMPVATSIGNSAFWNCTSLMSVDMPVATSIGNSAFHDCASLKNVDLPVATDIGQQAFTDCHSLTSIELPAATSAGAWAFQGCTSLTSIDLPAATSIGGSAFQGCTNLASVILRTTETVCVADPSAFADTPLMTGQGHIYVPTVMFEYYRAGYEETLNAMMPGFFDILFRKIEDYTVDGTLTGELDESKI